MSFIENSAFRRLAYYLGSSEFFSRHDDNNFSPDDNKRYLRLVSSLRGHLRLWQREPRLNADVFERAVALMEAIHEGMPRLLKQTGTEAGLECLATLECQVADLGKALSEASGTLKAEKKRPGGAVVPSLASFAGQWENTSLGGGAEPSHAPAGPGQAPATPNQAHAAPRGSVPPSAGGLTAASFMDSESFAALAGQKRAEAAAAKAEQRRVEETVAAKAGQAAPASIVENATDKTAGMEKTVGSEACPAETGSISPESLAACTEYFTASASLHGRAAKIWGLLACVGAAVFCYFFYYASLDLQIAARSAAGAGYEGLFFADLLLTKIFVFLPWFCVILLCIRSCRIEREHQARILYRKVSLNLYIMLGDGLDPRGRSNILGGIIAPETTARS